MAPNGNLVPETKKMNGYTVDTHLKLPKEIGTDYSFKRDVVWFNAIGFLFLHLAGLIGFVLIFFSHPLTIVWSKYIFYFFFNIRLITL